ncbi:MAG: hypothetical protein M3461_09450 [Pseudomonadota bacterium]|nr:hypothetical protein [Pseudomonadota bacterium]
MRNSSRTLSVSFGIPITGGLDDAHLDALQIVLDDLNVQELRKGLESGHRVGARDQRAALRHEIIVLPAFDALHGRERLARPAQRT